MFCSGRLDDSGMHWDGNFYWHTFGGDERSVIDELCFGYLISVCLFASSNFADGGLFNVSFLIYRLNNTNNIEYFI